MRSIAIYRTKRGVVLSAHASANRSTCTSSPTSADGVRRSELRFTVGRTACCENSIGVQAVSRLLETVFQNVDDSIDRKTGGVTYRYDIGRGEDGAAGALIICCS